MSIELTLNDINKAAMCVMGANQGDTQLMEGLLNKDGIKKNGLGRGKLILLRECLKPHINSILEITASDMEAADKEAALLNKVNVACDKIDWNILAQSSEYIDDLEMDFLLPIIEFK
jgi:hypothetical protein